MFDQWWSHAEAHYLGLRDGRLGDTLTLYYDPILRYDHRRGPESALMLAVYLAPQRPQASELIFAAGAERLGWTSDGPVREPRGNPRSTLWGLILAREFGNSPYTTSFTSIARRVTSPPSTPPQASLPGGSASANPIRVVN